MRELHLQRWVFVFVALLASGCEVVGIGGGTKYEASFSGPMNYSLTGNVVCTSTYAVTGRVEIELDEGSGSTAKGEGTIFVSARPGPPSPASCGSAPDRNWEGGEDFTGPASDIRFDHEYTATGNMRVVTRSSFAGALSGDQITGTVAIGWTGTGVSPFTSTEAAAATFNVTLRKSP